MRRRHPVSAAAGAVLAVLAIASPAQEDAASRRAPLFPIGEGADFPDGPATFDEVRRLIREHYYADSITDEALYLAAIRGMLRLVSPPHDPDRAAIWSPQQYARIADGLHGVSLSSGVKSTFDAGDGSLTVTSIDPGSPAVGRLRPHDRIVRIAGARLGGRTPAEIDAMLRGAPGDRVVLTVVRDVEVVDVEIVLERYEVANVETSALPNQVGYVRIRKFTQGASGEFRDALAALGEQASKGVVVDLRGNEGGVFAEGLRTAETFLPRATPMLNAVEREGRKQTIVSDNDTPSALAVAIVVDRRTASAAEIFAAALKSHHRAIVVGTRTYGKSTVEKTFDLANGYRVKFIVGALYGPGGESWYKDGIPPDVDVDGAEGIGDRVASLPMEQRLGADDALRAAWQVLR